MDTGGKLLPQGFLNRAAQLLEVARLFEDFKCAELHGLGRRFEICRS
jgi:hypothetical protein